MVKKFSETLMDEKQSRELERWRRWLFVWEPRPISLFRENPCMPGDYKRFLRCWLRDEWYPESELRNVAGETEECRRACERKQGSYFRVSLRSPRLPPGYVEVGVVKAAGGDKDACCTSARFAHFEVASQKASATPRVMYSWIQGHYGLSWKGPPPIARRRGSGPFLILQTASQKSRLPMAVDRS